MLRRWDFIIVREILNVKSTVGLKVLGFGVQGFKGLRLKFPKSSDTYIPSHL